MKSSKGFSLIEVLAATVIMGVLVTAVLAPLTQLFKRSSASSRTLQATTQAQNVVEFVKGQWRTYPRDLDASNADLNINDRTASINRYDRNCYSAEGLSTVPGVTYAIVTRAVDRDGVAGATLALSTNCLTAVLNPNPPLVKRITVTATDADNRQSILSVDVARP